MLPNVTLIGIDCVDIERLRLAADISTKEIAFGAVKLLTSIKSDDSRIVQISPIRSTREYSDFIIKELSKYVDTDFAIVFQYDGFILNASAWSDAFLQYDYIGAPWYHLGDLHVGNGGFSLRSKRLIDWLAKNWNTVGVRIDPEDVFIAKFARPYLERAGMSFAPEDIAGQFSKEGNQHSVVWNGEFGFHGINYTDISRWLNDHPQYKSQLTYKLDDYTTLMKKYPVYDGTINTFVFRKFDLENYKKMAENRKGYEIRITKGKYQDLGNIKQGHTIVFKRSGVSFKDVPVPAFERTVTKVEHFESFKSLRRAYPTLRVTYPFENIPKWQRPFVKFFGDLAYPKGKSYTVFWF